MVYNPAKPAPTTTASTPDAVVIEADRMPRHRRGKRWSSREASAASSGTLSDEPAWAAPPGPHERTCRRRPPEESSQHDDGGADVGEIPGERGVAIGLALAATRQPLTELVLGHVRAAVLHVDRDAVEADRAPLRLQPAHHLRQDRLAVPGRGLFRLAVHLVRAGQLVAVLATGDEPRPHDAALVVDGPHPLADALVHE